MKADWMIRIELARFFENHSELRARTSKGVLKDKIHRAVFSKTLEEEFSNQELTKAIEVGYIASEQIMADGQVRNIYVWLEKECVYQPTWYKRVIWKTKDWVENRFLVR